MVLKSVMQNKSLGADKISSYRDIWPRKSGKEKEELAAASPSGGTARGPRGACGSDVAHPSKAFHRADAAELWIFDSWAVMVNVYMRMSIIELLFTV